MDYNNFFTKDYKSLADGQKARRFAINRTHMFLIMGLLILLGTLLTFIANDARATRHADLDQTHTRIEFALDNPLGTEATNSDKQKPDWQTVTVKRGDALALIFSRLGISAQELHELMRLGKVVRPLKRIKPGQNLHFYLSTAKKLQALVFDIDQLHSLRINRVDNGFLATPVTHYMEKRVTFTSGTIKSSLFEAGTESGMSDALIMELVGIFGWDIDFALDIRKGDRFNLMYEEHYLDGKKIKEGPIVAAEFVNQGRHVRAIRYTDAYGHSQFYSEDGRSMRKAFLRTPVDFRRISSRFGNRYHPILNKKRLHKGVDYAAARGTPIHASGDGRVTFRGSKGGYGRTVIINHGEQYSTLYAHMSRYQRGVYAGKRVKQGQIIGYVGSSGRATGAHLHYEFRVNGTHRNPLTVRLPKAAPISKKLRDDFLYHAGKMVAQLNMHKDIRMARTSN